MGDQCHDRIEAQQRRGTAGNRLIIPLPLRLQSQRDSCFFKRDFDGPALEKPIQELLGLMFHLGREHGLGIKLLLGIANENPTEGFQQFTAVIPERRIATDVHLT